MLCNVGILFMVGGGLVAGPLLLRYMDNIPRTSIWVFWWVGLSMAGFVLLLIGSSPTRLWSRMFSMPSIVYVGKISYGMYLLHDLTFAFLDKLPSINWFHPSWILSLCTFAFRVLVVIGIAAASWRYFERPLLRLKDKIAPLSHGRRAVLLARPSE
jgi:peptidoglycan/LPS O-acetylase OafA/YrhL